MRGESQLMQKYNRSTTFKKEMDRAQANYKVFCQRIYYSSGEQPTQNFIIKYDGKNKRSEDIYFVYAAYQMISAQTLDKLMITFVAKIPKPNKPYVLVYFNSQQGPDGFSDFANTLELMPIEFLDRLEKLVLMKPTFGQKASRFFSFGVISSFVNDHLKHADTLQEMSDFVGINQHQVFQFLPKVVRNYYSQIKEGNKQMMVMENFKPQHQPIPFIKPKQIPRKMEIDQYDKCESGLPQILNNLIYYFKEHPEGLKQVGIFRKSANIEQETQFYSKIQNKNYQCLKKVQNPHLVANLIKKFLSLLLTPLIPYNIFEEMMEKKDLNPQFLSQMMKKLETINLTKLITLIYLLNFLITDVIFQQSYNKMNTQNIAICFSPCIMRAKEMTINEIVYAKKSVTVVQMMLSNFELVFGNEMVRSELYRESENIRRGQSYSQMQMALSRISQSDKKQLPQFLASTNYLHQKKSEKEEDSCAYSIQSLENIHLAVNSKIQTEKKQLPREHSNANPVSKQQWRPNTKIPKKQQFRQNNRALNKQEGVRKSKISLNHTQDLKIKGGMKQLQVKKNSQESQLRNSHQTEKKKVYDSKIQNQKKCRGGQFN